MTLAGAHALVTGGASGIGAACAEAILAEGAEVTVAGRTEGRLAEFAEVHGCRYAVMDITDEGSVRKAFSAAGAVDMIVANAGSAETAPCKRTSTDLFERMLRTNLTGTFLTIRTFLEQANFESPGRIVAIASTASLKGYAFSSAYAAAKHGVLGLIRSLALEMASTKITVNAVCPGFTRTAIAEDAIRNIVEKTGRTDEEALAELARFNPQRRLIEPEEVAQAVLGLLSQNSASMTGQAIAVDGGETVA
ncbi:MAG: SDR family oxidoreductase [Parvularcula sp.]|jgi:NAD(P)-dependent dehydrogenase (short-subunit alcohol dehydrogenase family)|nr:SDR family oxidoreductase [Parvularcula sp.]